MKKVLTQVYLEKKQKEYLERTAKRLKISMAELVRSILEKEIFMHDSPPVKSL